MPTVENWRSFLRGSRHDLQLGAARALLEYGKALDIADLLYIFDSFFAEGLGAATQRTLLQRAGPELVAPMKARLASPQSYVRESACTILGHCGDFSVTPALIAMLEDPVAMVRRAAGFALADLKDPASLDRLRVAAAAAASDDTNVQWAIDCAIREVSANR